VFLIGCEAVLLHDYHKDFVAPPHLFVPSNIEFDGGPNNLYDLDNRYQEA
jgi:hypothetical protein